MLPILSHNINRNRINHILFITVSLQINKHNKQSSIFWPKKSVKFEYNLNQISDQWAGTSSVLQNPYCQVLQQYWFKIKGKNDLVFIGLWLNPFYMRQKTSPKTCFVASWLVLRVWKLFFVESAQIRTFCQNLKMIE